MISFQENVFGLHCNECKSGTFALHAINPLGCIPCFCSGMTEFCAEVEGYVRVPVSKVYQSYFLAILISSSRDHTCSCKPLRLQLGWEDTRKFGRVLMFPSIVYRILLLSRI